MTIDSLDWESLWDIATPEQAAGIMRGLYGAGAIDAATEAAARARADGRPDDADFWDTARLALTRHPGNP